MKRLQALKAKAQGHVAKMREIAEKADAETRDLNADEQKAYDAEKAALEKTNKNISEEQSLVAAEKSLEELDTTEPTPPVIKSVTGGARVVVKEPELKLTGSQLLGFGAWAAARAKHSPKYDALEHLEIAGFTQIADRFKAHKAEKFKVIAERAKALGIEKALTTFTAGGAANAVDVPLSTDWIETLRNQTVFLTGGPVEIPLDYGGLRIAGGLAGATGTYTTEGADMPYTQMTTRDVDLQAKHLTAVTAIQNYLLEVSPLAVAQIVGDDLARGLALSMDSAGLRGDGSGANPMGILSLVDASHKFAATASGVAPTVAQIDADLRIVESKLVTSNVPTIRRRCLMSGRTFIYMKHLRNLATQDGSWAYPSLRDANPTLLNMPVALSEQIPSNLGVGTNESEIYFIDFGHVWFGIARSLRLDSSTEASYKDGTNTLVSAFSKDQTVIRGIGSHDFEMRYGKGAVVLTGVKWGA